MNKEVQSQLGIAAYSLFTIKMPASDPSSRTYEVMEARGDASCAPMHCAWMPIERIATENFNEEDSSAVSTAIQEMRSYVRGWALGPFGQTGWLKDLLCWVQEVITPLGLRLTGDLRQFNPCSTCALLRMETDGSAIWFKAVDETNLSEVSIAATLARELPIYVPSVIATHSSLHGWLTTECEGLTLNEINNASAWEQAAEAIAKLQIESLDKIDQLLSAGCRDLRVDELLRQVDAFMDVAAELMGRQEKISPPALTKNEVNALGVSVKQAIADWSKLNIPDGLGHLDISPHNIVVSPDRCVFLDWAEAYVGPPFLTIDFLRGHFRQAAISEGSQDSTLVVRYRKQWEFILPLDAVTEGLELARLLAPFAYALGIGHWRDRETVFSSENAGYLRSLIRRMHRESRMLQERRRVCLNS